MPTFIFQAIDDKGTTIKDKIEALSSEEVLETIRSRSLYPTTIKQVKDKALIKSTTAKSPC